MNYKDFQNRVDYGTQMFDSGNMQAALEIFTGLVSVVIYLISINHPCVSILLWSMTN